MDAHAAPLRALDDHLEYFVRDNTIELAVVECSHDLRRHVLTLIASKELSANASAPIFVLEQAHGRRSPGWMERAAALREQHEHRRRVFADAGEHLSPLVPAVAGENDLHTVGSSAREWTIRATNDEGRAAIAQMAEAQQNAIGHSGAYRQGDNSCLTHARDVWNSPFERSATRGGASNPYIPPNDMRTLDQFDHYMHNRFSGPGEGQINDAGLEIVDRPWDLW